MSTIKKTILIILFILIITLLGFLLYFFFFKQAPLTTAPITTETNIFKTGLPETREGAPKEIVEIDTKTGLPITQKIEEITPVNPEIPITYKVSPIATGGETQITSLPIENVQELTLDSNGSNLLYYQKDSGEFYRLSPDGEIKTLLTKDTYPNVEKIYWSPKKDKAILNFPDNAKIVYDFNQKKQYALPKNWNDFSFAPQGDSIAFKTTSSNPDKRWLSIANSDGTEYKAIEPMGENNNKVEVNWSPNQQVIALYSESIGIDQQEVYFVGQNKENFLSMIVEGQDFRSKWSPKGDKLLYSIYNAVTNNNPTLWIADAEGENIGKNRISIGLQTWADKCIFSSDNETVYCAVPRNLPEGSGFYPELANESPSDFYKIDTRTGQNYLLASPANTDYIIDQIILSGDEKYLYFTDKEKGLRKIQLK
ncbi:hypothetical protein CVV26_02035 [Candidatus Kuenenbacteria bacterium HGW-Kuenenbacteria-1]|uniref:Dipeptidylpeptidase IV N-terminal domain-containing protein n=1 Tax=Candidatus Kuenenbacteria bacterium HGW-Kuenenbacteria-1 TaxID=2013812 RepID=A0A2N1UNC9_9BACT|nr:MAG: hypothetical protein CVV26_02035 [Candidatus Kuenenbacteria bacterium HGW-Kuenenbacteria-1]